jgi:hypothetical protein
MGQQNIKSSHFFVSKARRCAGCVVDRRFPSQRESEPVGQVISCYFSHPTTAVYSKKKKNYF